MEDKDIKSERLFVAGSTLDSIHEGSQGSSRTEACGNDHEMTTVKEKLPQSTSGRLQNMNTIIYHITLHERERERERVIDN